MQIVFENIFDKYHCVYCRKKIESRDGLEDKLTKYVANYLLSCKKLYRGKIVNLPLYTEANIPIRFLTNLQTVTVI